MQALPALAEAVAPPKKNFLRTVFRAGGLLFRRPSGAILTRARWRTGDPCKALEASIRGAHIFIIANADTVLTRSNAEVLSEFWPSVPLKRTFAPNETLLSIEKARRVLGYEPQYSWRAA